MGDSKSLWGNYFSGVDTGKKGKNGQAIMADTFGDKVNSGEFFSDALQTSSATASTLSRVKTSTGDRMDERGNVTNDTTPVANTVSMGLEGYKYGGIWGGIIASAASLPANIVDAMRQPTDDEKLTRRNSFEAGVEVNAIAPEATFSQTQNMAGMDPNIKIAREGLEVSGEKPVEVERDEIVLRKNGKSFRQVADFRGGKTHEQGGEDYQASEGDIIIPGKHRGKVKRLMKHRRWSGIESLRQSLPKDTDAPKYKKGTQEITVTDDDKFGGNMDRNFEQELSDLVGEDYFNAWANSKVGSYSRESTAGWGKDVYDTTIFNDLYEKYSGREDRTELMLKDLQSMNFDSKKYITRTFDPKTEVYSDTKYRNELMDATPEEMEKVREEGVKLKKKQDEYTAYVKEEKARKKAHELDFLSKKLGAPVTEEDLKNIIDVVGEDYMEAWADGKSVGGYEDTLYDFSTINTLAKNAVVDEHRGKSFAKTLKTSEFDTESAAVEKWNAETGKFELTNYGQINKNVRDRADQVQKDKKSSAVTLKNITGGVFEGVVNEEDKGIQGLTEEEAKQNSVDSAWKEKDAYRKERESVIKARKTREKIKQEKSGISDNRQKINENKQRLFGTYTPPTSYGDVGTTTETLLEKEEIKDRKKAKERNKENRESVKNSGKADKKKAAKKDLFEDSLESMSDDNKEAAKILKESYITEDVQASFDDLGEHTSSGVGSGKEVYRLKELKNIVEENKENPRALLDILEGNYSKDGELDLEYFRVGSYDEDGKGSLDTDLFNKYAKSENVNIERNARLKKDENGYFPEKSETGLEETNPLSSMQESLDVTANPEQFFRTNTSENTDPKNTKKTEQTSGKSEKKETKQTTKKNANVERHLKTLEEYKTYNDAIAKLDGNIDGIANSYAEKLKKINRANLLEGDGDYTMTGVDDDKEITKILTEIGAELGLDVDDPKLRGSLYSHLVKNVMPKVANTEVIKNIVTEGDNGVFGVDSPAVDIIRDQNWSDSDRAVDRVFDKQYGKKKPFIGSTVQGKTGMSAKPDYSAYGSGLGEASKKSKRYLDAVGKDIPGDKGKTVETDDLRPPEDKTDYTKKKKQYYTKKPAQVENVKLSGAKTMEDVLAEIDDTNKANLDAIVADMPKKLDDVVKPEVVEESQDFSDVLDGVGSGLSTLAEYSPAIYNMVKGLGTADKIGRNYVNPKLEEYKNRSQSQINMIDDAFKGSMSKARNLSGGSMANYRANASSAYANKLRSTGEVNTMEAGRADDVASRNINTINQAKQVNAEVDNRADQVDMQSEAARRSFFGQGVSDMANISAMRKRDKRADTNQTMMLKFMTQGRDYDLGGFKGGIDKDKDNTDKDN